MKEAQIRKIAIQNLEEDGWLCWFARKVKFWECDIFGIADIIIDNGKKMKLIQLTTLSNMSARRKKIKALGHKFSCPVEIWGYNKKKKEFKVIRI